MTHNKVNKVKTLFDDSLQNDTLFEKDTTNLQIIKQLVQSPRLKWFRIFG